MTQQSIQQPANMQVKVGFFGRIWQSTKNVLFLENGEFSTRKTVLSSLLVGYFVFINPFMLLALLELALIFYVLYMLWQIFKGINWKQPANA